MTSNATTYWSPIFIGPKEFSKLDFWQIQLNFGAKLFYLLAINKNVVQQEHILVGELNMSFK